MLRRYDPWCAEIKAKKTAVGQTDDAPSDYRIRFQ